MHQHRLYKLGKSREHQCLLSNSIGSANLRERAIILLGMQHNLRVKHIKKRFKIPPSCGIKKGIHNFSLSV